MQHLNKVKQSWFVAARLPDILTPQFQDIKRWKKHGSCPCVLHIPPSEEIQGFRFRCAEKWWLFTIFTSYFKKLPLTVTWGSTVINYILLCNWCQSQYITYSIWSTSLGWDQPPNAEPSKPKQNRTHMLLKLTHGYLWIAMEVTHGYLWKLWYQNSLSKFLASLCLRNLFACDTWIAGGTAQEDSWGRYFHA